MNKNVGFYIKKINGSERNVNIFNALNTAVMENHVRDASVFFNDVEHNPVVPRFGMFNASDIWAFTGVLFSVSLENSLMANSIVNKFKLYHIFNSDEDKNLMGLITVSNSIDVITQTEKDSKEYYRLTGKKPLVELSDQSIKHMLESIE
jgi:hypothetical protein